MYVTVISKEESSCSGRIPVTDASHGSDYGKVLVGDERRRGTEFTGRYCFGYISIVIFQDTFYTTTSFVSGRQKGGKY